MKKHYTKPKGFVGRSICLQYILMKHIWPYNRREQYSISKGKKNFLILKQNLIISLTIILSC